MFLKPSVRVGDSTKIIIKTFREGGGIYENVFKTFREGGGFYKNVY